MTVIDPTPQVTGVQITGLDTVKLPVISHFFDSELDSDPEWQSIFVDDKDKYIVKAMDGLGPPDQNVIISRTKSGGKYQDKTSVDREIVVLLVLNPDLDKGETPKILRDNLYTMIDTGYDPKVRFTLMAGKFPISFLDAYVTKVEPPLFEKDTLVQITFTCLNPTFAAQQPFSYGAGSLDQNRPNVYNYGTAATGFQFAVKFTDDMSRWFLKTAENQKIGMVFDKDFHTGDILSVSTIPGRKYVHWQKHRGKVKNEMSILSNNSEWITLHPGNNHFVVPKKDSKWDWHGKLTFTAQYWGV